MNKSLGPAISTTPGVLSEYEHFVSKRAKTVRRRRVQSSPPETLTLLNLNRQLGTRDQSLQ